MANRNVGSVDRAVRAVVGIVALVIAFTFLDVMSGGLPGVIVAVVGAVLLLTAIVRFCPAYLPIGVSTCKRD